MSITQHSITSRLYGSCAPTVTILPVPKSGACWSLSMLHHGSLDHAI